MDNEVKDIENNVTPESVEVTKKPATKSQTDEKNVWYKKVLPMLKTILKVLEKIFIVLFKIIHQLFGVYC